MSHKDDMFELKMKVLETSGVNGTKLIGTVEGKIEEPNRKRIWRYITSVYWLALLLLNAVGAYMSLPQSLLLGLISLFLVLMTGIYFIFNITLAFSRKITRSGVFGISNTELYVGNLRGKPSVRSVSFKDLSIEQTVHEGNWFKMKMKGTNGDSYQLEFFALSENDKDLLVSLKEILSASNT